ncbi:hypothetical protein METBIDRAFT_143490 [Metschnikowia bicuspidata var. bicuspidata NRRL YB-4993]|uniref:Alcohol acetyltransferase n=1 Tax=Metschnikowia bicuspidata var. bicuspidata NRRL YB-4993 TaxID=869754 RepID=A0A1A0HDJ6_9ASCO|nr:hypothetical protein METBIDRAFT_143490 [Metschnikowia bicuspidata var. bicuspidata NRRL YB-4993]OBA21967.1 hypothetical protein METBIDRAFT_143490 [Metschnikowia bicuspidata var. bicuspidata NRRL YB-4993]
MAVTIQDLTRDLEFLEQALYYCEKNEMYKSVGISAKLNRPLGEEQAFASLRLLVLKYPLLFSHVVEKGQQIRYEPVEEIRFKDVFTVNRDVDRCFKEEGANTRLLTEQSSLENHHNKHALWKLTYYERTGWITFNSAHCFTDGGSVVAYLKDFVEGLNNVDKPETRDVLFNLSKDLPILEHKISPGFFDRVNYLPNLATRLLFRGLQLAISVWPGIIHSVLEKKRFELFFVDRPPERFLPDTFFESTYIVGKDSGLNFTTPSFINFSPEQLNIMIQACRKNQVKLQTYLLMVYIHTLNELYPDLYMGKNLKTSVAASFRNRFDCLQTHTSYLGNEGRFDDGFYTYAASFLLPPGTKFTWGAVRKYHDYLHTTLSSEDWVKQYYLAQAMPVGVYMDPVVGQEKDDLCLSATNLGHISVLQYDDGSKFQIEDILFAPSAGALLGTHHMTVSSTTKNGLNIGITDGDPNITDWATLKAKFKLNLMDLLEC